MKGLTKRYVNKTVSALITLIMLLGSFSVVSAQASSATAVADEDFTSFNKDLYTATAGVVRQTGHNDYAMNITDAGFGKVLGTPIKEGFAVVSTLLYSGTTTGKIRIQRVWNAYNEQGKYRFYEIYFQNGNINVMYYKSGVQKNNSMCQYSANTWYQVTSIIDIKGGKFYPFINGHLVVPEGLEYNNSDLIGTKQIAWVSIGQNEDVKGVLRYIDDFYIDSFKSFDAAKEAVRVKAVQAGYKDGFYTDKEMNDYKTASESYLAALRVSDDSTALNSLKNLSDTMIPEVTHVLYSENLESQTADSAPTFSNEAGNNCVTIREVSKSEVSKSNVLELSGAGARVARASTGIGSAWDKVSVEADVMWKDASFAMDFVLDITGTSSHYKPWTTIADESNLYLRTGISADGTPVGGNWYQKKIIENIQPNQWYNLRFVMDKKLNTVTAYVDGVEKASGLIYENYLNNANYDIRRPHDTKINANSTGTFYMDNFRITNTSAVPRTTLVQNGVYLDENGDSVNKMTSNGKMKSVLVTKNYDTATDVFTALYDKDGNFIDVKKSDISNLETGKQTAVNVDLSLPENIEGYTIRQFVFNENLVPAVKQNVKVSSAEGATLHIIGDSTVSNYDKNYYPEAGWGQMIGNYLPGVKINNVAVSGETLKGFWDRPARWQALLSQMNPGDYLLIQFGTNDSKPFNAADPDNGIGTGTNWLSLYSAVNTNYRAFLKLFVESAQEQGVTPILVTPPQRRIFNSVFGGNAIIGTYAEAMKSVGKELNVSVIDLNKKTVDLVNENGADSDYIKKQVYLYLEPQDSNYTDNADFSASTYHEKGIADNTHFSRYGAAVFAKFVAEGLKDLGIELSDKVDLNYTPAFPVK